MNERINTHGKNDVALSSYFLNPQIFADMFNAWMYGGKQVIDPGNLTTEDPVQPRPEYARPYKHVRDVVKMYQMDGVQLVLLGIENQEKIDYSAPVRIMQFDSADYQNQVRRTEEENRKRMEETAKAMFPEWISACCGSWKRKAVCRKAV